MSRNEYTSSFVRLILWEFSQPSHELSCLGFVVSLPSLLRSLLIPPAVGCYYLMLILGPGILENLSVFLLHSQLSAIPVYLCHRWGLSPHSCPLLPIVEGYYLLLGARLVLLLLLSHRPQNFAWLWEWNFAVPAQWLKAFVSFERRVWEIGWDFVPDPQ